ncbi:hypothetical protein EV2_008243 [Malus domestica]
MAKATSLLNFFLIIVLLGSAAPIINSAAADGCIVKTLGDYQCPNEGFDPQCDLLCKQRLDPRSRSECDRETGGKTNIWCTCLLDC